MIYDEPGRAHAQHPDGSWRPAKPMAPRGLVARVEAWARRHGMRRLAILLGRIEEA